MLAVLFLYAFVSNVALAVVPHEPVVAWYGSRLGIWPTALVATAGTVAASWADYRLFQKRVAHVWSVAVEKGRAGSPWLGWLRTRFARSPDALVAASGLTPLPFWPFKALAFSVRLPLARYLAAVAIGRLPRYLLLAWLGAAFRVPAWPFALAFLLLLIPSLRGLPWRRQPDN